MSKLKKLIGNRAFYKMVLAVAVPIMIQNGISYFVSLLDNIMVGQVGTEAMSGVAIVNNLMMVFNVCIFGVVSGAGIFGAQFFGKGDHEGVRSTFRFKVILCGVAAILGIGIFLVFGEPLINLYLQGGGEVGDAALTLQEGKNYLMVMLVGLIPFCIVQTYASTLRETGETVLPMFAGIVAVFVNLIFNYILIFGHFGAPRMGVTGAAVATVIARFVETAIIVFWTHKRKDKNRFAEGAYKSLAIPMSLVKQICVKGTPLMINEALWSAGMAILLQCYSIRGLEVVAGVNIASTVANLFNVVFMSLGSSVAIIIGQLLGAGKMEEAMDQDCKLLFFSVAVCVVIGGVLALLSPLFPELYNTEASVKRLAAQFICIEALCMPMNAFAHAAYFTLRSGGKTVITFLFDSVFTWVVSVPLAFCFSRFTLLPVVMVYLFVKLADIIKCVIGYILIKKGVWMQNIVVKQS